jgi:hypothetical protein
MTTPQAPKRNLVTFQPEPDIYSAMARLRRDEGVIFAQQLNRAMRAWLVARGELPGAKGKVKVK